jgi:hypothetical protein
MHVDGLTSISSSRVPGNVALKPLQRLSVTLFLIRAIIELAVSLGVNVRNFSGGIITLSLERGQYGLHC